MKLMLERPVTNLNVWLKEDEYLWQQRLVEVLSTCCQIYRFAKGCSTCNILAGFIFLHDLMTGHLFWNPCKKCAKVICIATAKLSFSEEAAAVFSGINTQTILKTWPLIPSSQCFYWLQGSLGIWGTHNGLRFHSLELSRLPFSHIKQSSLPTAVLFYIPERQFQKLPWSY